MEKPISIQRHARYVPDLAGISPDGRVIVPQFAASNPDL